MYLLLEPPALLASRTSIVKCFPKTLLHPCIICRRTSVQVRGRAVSVHAGQSLARPGKKLAYLLEAQRVGMRGAEDAAAAARKLVQRIEHLVEGLEFHGVRRSFRPVAGP